MLKVNDLRFRYGNIEVVHGISFEAASNKITAIIGTNGAGKTTTIKAIMGLSSIASGRIEWNGKFIENKRAHKVTKMGIALCPEGRQLFSNLTVHENILMGAYNLDKQEEIDEGIENVYRWFPRLKERCNQLAATLSGGEQEMLAIGRALISKPQLLMLDEPSWGLAPILVDKVEEIIREINQAGVTIILVEQNFDMAMKLADYVYVLETGYIVNQGTPAQLTADASIIETYLGV